MIARARPCALGECVPGEAEIRVRVPRGFGVQFANRPRRGGDHGVGHPVFAARRPHRGARALREDERGGEKVRDGIHVQGIWVGFALPWSRTHDRSRSRPAKRSPCSTNAASILAKRASSLSKPAVVSARRSPTRPLKSARVRVASTPKPADPVVVGGRGDPRPKAVHAVIHVGHTLDAFRAARGV
jgi:hypothetical protein